MKTFLLYLKNYSDAPDFEREANAETKEEALKKIRKETGHSLDEWEDDILLENMGETEEDIETLEEQAERIKQETAYEEQGNKEYPLGGMIEPYDIEKEKEL